MRPATLEEVQERLRAELRSRGDNLRQLAREIAERDGASIETARRALYRILNEDVAPTAPTSAMLERGLRRRPGFFTVERLPSVGSRRDRQAKLEVEVGLLRASLETALEAHRELVARVEALEQAPHRAGKRAAGASPRAPRQR